MLQRSTKKFLLLLSIIGELIKYLFLAVYKEPVFGVVKKLSCVDLVIIRHWSLANSHAI